MNSEVISTSLQLDSLVQEKLKSFWKSDDINYLSTCELKTEVNNLRYLIYILNQDRIVIIIKNLRQELTRRISMCSSQPENQLEKEFVGTFNTNSPDRPLHQYDLYEITGNSSEICTVINTSILPNSYESTEREFSPFSASPMISPRIINPENRIATVFMTTEATFNRNKPTNEIKTPEVLRSDDFIVSSSETSEINLSIFTLNSSNYIQQHIGDEVLSPSCICSKCHSRENSISPDIYI